MKSEISSFAVECLTACVLLAMGPRTWAAESRLLWHIGEPDHNDAEFALAPNRYSSFRDDPFFVVGKSDAKRDWPYVQPGPADSWAGGRQHQFTIAFGLLNGPLSGDCRLRLDLVDTHGTAPPGLRITVNGTPLRPTADRRAFQLPPGAGDASVNGQPDQGKPSRLEVPFPAKLLKEGANEIALTTVLGSWLLYDWIGLETPPYVELAAVTGALVSSVESLPTAP